MLFQEIYRQYDEYDAVQDAGAIPFRQAVGFGQIVQWQEEKLTSVLEALGHSYSSESITRRLPLARNWLTKYNPDELIALNESVNTPYVSQMSDAQKELIHNLRSELEKGKATNIDELEELVYEIPKDGDRDEAELKKAQRSFFKDVYNLLIGKDTGPRLGTFLWAVDRKQVIKLLSIV